MEPSNDGSFFVFIPERPSIIEVLLIISFDMDYQMGVIPAEVSDQTDTNMPVPNGPSTTEQFPMIGNFQGFLNNYKGNVADGLQADPSSTKKAFNLALPEFNTAQR